MLVIVWLPHKSFLSIELIPHKTLLTDIKRVSLATPLQCVPVLNHPTILTELQIIPILPDSVIVRRMFNNLSITVCETREQTYTRKSTCPQQPGLAFY